MLLSSQVKLWRLGLLLKINYSENLPRIQKILEMLLLLLLSREFSNLAPIPSSFSSMLTQQIIQELL
jgi:hypothetical protein